MAALLHGHCRKIQFIFVCFKAVSLFICVFVCHSHFCALYWFSVVFIHVSSARVLAGVILQAAKKNPFNACWLWSLSLCWHGRKYIQKMKFTGFENLVWPKEKKCAPSESHRTSYYKHQWFLISQSKAHRHSTHTTHLRRGKEREKILPTTKRRRYTLLDG